jgi:hypothetical protein
VNISNRLLRGRLACEKTVVIGYILTHEFEFELRHESVRRDTYHGILRLHTALGFNVMLVRSHPGDSAPRIEEESVLGENKRPFKTEIYKTHSS